MRTSVAWATLVVTGLLSLAAFAAPLWCVAAILASGILAMRHRLPFLAAAAVGAAVNVALFAFLLPGRGAAVGLAGSLRLAAGLAINLAVLSRVPLPRLLDGLRLPPPATAFLAAVLATVQGLGRDFDDLVRAARLEGSWPQGRLRRAAAAAALLPPLLVLALRHGEARRDALRLAGHDTAPGFAAVVAVTALAAAGRMAVVAVPNDPVTYTAVFLGGVLFGWRIGAVAGIAAMSITNLLLSGLLPAAFANVPAMALVGILGGWAGRLRLGRERHWVTATLVAACGALAVLLFSACADVATWLLVPEYRGEPTALLGLLAAGLAFNVLPAIAAAILFTLSVGPVVRAAEAAGLTTMPAMGNPD